jgi:hypothetical protein
MVTSGPPCPSCGVAVVPGYVKCPKCGAFQPRVKRTSIQPGGTAVVTRDRFPMMPVVLGVGVALAIALFFGLRGGHASEPQEPSASPVDENGDVLNPSESVPGAIPPPAIAPATPKPAPPPAPSPQAAVNDLSRTLRVQRLWATLSFNGVVLEVRSASCGEAELSNAIASAASPLRAAGLTKLRCVEQSGRVVFERDI